MNNRKTLYLSSAVVIVLIGLVLSAIFLNQKKVPEFSLTTLDGKHLTQKDLEGKVTLINFWATTCSGCIAEMPMLEQTSKKYSEQGFQIVAIAMSYDPEEQVRKFVAKNNLPFITGIDKDNKVADAFGDIKLTPTSILVDKKGNIIKTIVGEPDEQKLHQLIEAEIS